MSKRARFTDKQAKFLCDSLEANGWTVFEKNESLACPSCGEGQEIEWDYCPYCGADHSENPCERDSIAISRTVELVRELVEEALSV